MAQLKEGFSIQQLVNGGVEFEINFDEAELAKEESLENQDYEENLLNYHNSECLGAEDTYDDSEPFDSIAQKMTNLIEDGGVKKRIIREGYGEVPPDMATVRINYNAYLEYDATPFDSTYSRNRKHEFIINNAEVITGLDIAVQSMKINEKSQFLFKSEYAYGKLGCLGRIPGGASCLFEIELLEIIDTGAALNYNKLPEEKQKDFEEVYKYCLALCAKGKEKFNRNTSEAVKEYYMALDRIDNVIMNNQEQENKQQELVDKLLGNILVCNTKLELPKKGCMAANRLIANAKSNYKKLPAKVYYCNAKCLRMLGDLNHALRKLKIAHQMEPKNPDIANEFIHLQQEIDEQKKKDKELAQSMMGTKLE